MMFCGWLPSAASLLLLIAAVTASVNRDDGIGVRVDWCSRVCPIRTTSPPAVGSGAPPPECQNITCPVPECPVPECPTVPPPPPACASCPEGPPSAPRTLPWKALKNYTITPHGHYKHYDMYVDWFDAQILCESEGAHLLIVNSEEEDNFIRNLMKPGWIHIGIHNLFPDRGFSTVLGKPLNSTGFDKWLSGHSTRNDTNNCGFVNKSKSGLGLGLCSDRGRFVCEISFG